MTDPSHSAGFSLDDVVGPSAAAGTGPTAPDDAKSFTLDDVLEPRDPALAPPAAEPPALPYEGPERRSSQVIIAEVIAEPAPQTPSPQPGPPPLR